MNWGSSEAPESGLISIAINSAMSNFKKLIIKLLQMNIKSLK